MADEFEGTERFLLIRRIGAGGMGVVYEALDRERNARVALKTLRTIKPDAILRFKNEFRSLSDLHHPNLASLGELFEHQGQWFFTMELVRGVHFLDYVRKPAPSTPGVPLTTEDQPTNKLGPEGERPTHEPPSPPAMRLASGADEIRLRGAMAQLALGLVELHRAHKVHRDIKPSNILVTPEGRVVLLDFGLVADLVSASKESHLVGTFSYMAPEQASMKAVGAAADWYSVGVLLYQALTGRLPVTGNAREVLILKQAFEPPPPSSLAIVPEDLDRLAADLLRIDQTTRPTGREILRRLHAESRESLPEIYGHVAHFVGRQREIGELRKAFGAVLGGSGVTVLVHGESGVGKSALVRRFASTISAEHPRTVVFAGRCYERENMPYKAVDGVIDALSRHLTSLNEDDLKPLLPRQRGLMGQVFPVMRKVEAIAEAPRPLPGQLDPQVLRARLFFALRDLFHRLGEHHPLVLVIDDLQWADADSLALLSELMRGPDEPKLLLIGTMRAALKTELERLEEGDGGGGVQRVAQVASVFTGDVRVLGIEALPPEDARALVDALLRDAGAGEDVSAGELAHEAKGHPLFIDELVRSRVMAGDSAGAVRLEDALQMRIARLGESSRRLLELIAVAGAPLVWETAAHAARVDFSEFAREATLLRAQNLVRTTGVRKSDTLEPYHDRVREAVLLHLEPAARTAWHGRLALALEATGNADPEALAMHWRGGGDADKAVSYAVIAAAQAEEAFAFDRAARLYKLALELRPSGGAEGSALFAKLGNALANAGRSADAAGAYLRAVETASGDAALELRRKVAEQFLRSGLFEKGLEQLRIVLAAVGMDLPKTPQRALVSLLVRRAQVRLRGINFKEHRAADVTADALERIDICWSAGVVLGMVDNLRGADFQARGLLLALEAGEPERIARALGLEACFASTAGGAGKKRVEMLLDATAASARKAATPFVQAFCALVEGTAAYCMGEFKRSFEASLRAKEMFTDRCTGVAWERETADLYINLSAFYLGRIKELVQRVDTCQREADERGDLFASTYARSGLAIMSWLAKDDAESARRDVSATLGKWTSQSYLFAHFWCFIASAQIDLYSGAPEEAYRRAAAEWQPLSDSLLLRSVQIVRVESLHVRARAALGLAAARDDGRKLLREAEHDAQRLEDEEVTYATGFAALIRAAIARRRGDLAAALSLLESSAASFDAADMKLYAAAARRRRGELLGDEGAITSADAWMQSEEIESPERMVNMLAPGFSSRRA